MKNKNLPAFPVECSYDEVGSTPIGMQTTNYSGYEKGLSKREYIATHILNGLIAQCDPGSWKANEMQYLASQAVEFTDALLTELSKTENDLP